MQTSDVSAVAMAKVAGGCPHFTVVHGVTRINYVHFDNKKPSRLLQCK